MAVHLCACRHATYRSTKLCSRKSRCPTAPGSIALETAPRPRARLATDFGKDDPEFRSDWIRTFGTMSGNPKGAPVWGTEGNGPAGFGTVFQFDTRTNVLTTLHAFTGPDGKNPIAGLVRDPRGTLYGVAAFGGTANKGVLFQITP